MQVLVLSSSTAKGGHKTWRSLVVSQREDGQGGIWGLRFVLMILLELGGGDNSVLWCPGENDGTFCILWLYKINVKCLRELILPHQNLFSLCPRLFWSSWDTVWLKNRKSTLITINYGGTPLTQTWGENQCSPCLTVRLLDQLRQWDSQDTHVSLQSDSRLSLLLPHPLMAWSVSFVFSPSLHLGLRTSFSWNILHRSRCQLSPGPPLVPGGIPTSCVL